MKNRVRLVLLYYYPFLTIRIRNDLVRHIHKEYQTKEADLTSTSRNRKSSETRQVVGWLALKTEKYRKKYRVRLALLHNRIKRVRLVLLHYCSISTNLFAWRENHEYTSQAGSITLSLALHKTIRILGGLSKASNICK
jgi:hypothetical protein